MEFRADINGLRAIAVLSVVLYHFGVPAFSGGFVGVDVFFVISGYLLTSIARRDIEAGRYSIVRFLSNRMRRIFPALCVVLLACVLWATYSYLPGDYKRIVRDAMSALVIRSNYAFVNNAGYFAPDSQQNILLHTWSLSVESQFYLVFAFLCGTFWPASGQSAKKIGFALFSGLAAASLAWCLLHTPANQPASFYLLWSRAWEFMAGSMVATYGVRKLRIAHANTLASVGAILLIGSIVGLDSTMPYPGWRALFPVVGTMLIIYRSGSKACIASSLSLAGPIRTLDGDAIGLNGARRLSSSFEPITPGQHAHQRIADKRYALDLRVVDHAADGGRFRVAASFSQRTMTAADAAQV